MRLLRLFGNTTSSKVIPSVGAEQEYFLVDREKYLKRKDLVFTGRTLFGAMPPKGQELDDHYFGTIRQRVASYMKDVNEELWNSALQQRHSTTKWHLHSTNLHRSMQSQYCSGSQPDYHEDTEKGSMRAWTEMSASRETVCRSQRIW